ncbi:MAG: YciI family protein [Aliiglaciecola sp.]
MSNKNYMCILRTASGECEKPSPADMEAMHARYQAWQQKFSENIVSMGGALGSSGAVVSNDAVKDGPFVEVKEIIGGYMMIQAQDLEGAVEVIKASPMVSNPSTSIEIREISTP